MRSLIETKKELSMLLQQDDYEKLLYFKQNPEHVGSILDELSIRVKVVSLDKKKYLFNCLLNCCESVYQIITENENQQESSKIIKKLKTQIKNKAVFELLNFVNPDKSINKMAIGFIHINDLYNILYQETRQGIVDKLISELT